MERTYKKIEIVYISETSRGEASQNAVAKACQSLRHVDWFGVAEQCMIMSSLLTDRRGKSYGTNVQED